MSKKILFYGKPGAGKTSAIIGALKIYLKECPDLRIGVLEKYPEVKEKIPEVISINKLKLNDVVKYDLVIITGGFDFSFERELVRNALLNEVSIWWEICTSREKLKELYETIPCLKEFDKVECK